MKGVCFILLIGCLGCNSYKFLGEKPAKEKPEECEISVLIGAPDYAYEEIGKCRGKGFSFQGDGSRAALKKLQNCACKYGGDAVILIKSSDRTLDTNNDEGVKLTSSKIGATMTGMVIRRKKN